MEIRTALIAFDEESEIKPGAALTAPPAKAGSSAMIIIVIECRK